MNIVTIIERIRSTPDYYLRTLAVSELKAFLDGFMFAMGHSIEGQANTMDLFAEWLIKRAKGPTPDVSWDYHVALPHRTNAQALAYFFVLWDSFVAEQCSDLSKSSTPKDPTIILSLSTLTNELALENRYVSDFYGLVAFLNGYQSYCGEPPVDFPGNDLFFNRFISWIQERRLLSNEYSWINILIFYSMGNIGRLLDDFFQSWKEFCDFEELLLEVERSPTHLKLLLHAASMCQKYNSSRGFSVYDNILSLNTLPSSEIAGIYYRRAQLKQYALRNNTLALQDYRQAWTHHQSHQNESDPEWRALRNAIEIAIEELIGPCPLCNN